MIRKLYQILLLSIAVTLEMTTPTMAQWVQLGTDLMGQAAGAQAGFVTDLNAAGNRLAIGAPGDSTNGPRSGKVRVFQFNGMNWIPMGVDLLGDTAEDQFGSSVKFSANGNILIVGAPVRLLGTGTPPGYVRIFDWNGSNWVQRGSDLFGGVNADGFGSAIDLSSSGDIVAIGAPNLPTIADFGGKVSVHQWNGTNWLPMGSAIAGLARFSFTGGAVQLNSTGTVLAVGQEGQSRVLVFDWDGSNWVLKDTILGTQNFGNSISMDSSGHTLAIGGVSLPTSIGRVSVFQFNGTEYIQKGSSIDGQGDDLFFGWEQNALALREDGNALAAGSLGNVVAGQTLGRVRVMVYNGVDWVPDGIVSGSANDSQLGRSVCMNADGSTIALGTPFNLMPNQNAGVVRVFTNSVSTAIHEYDQHDLKVFPNPAHSTVHISTNSEILHYEILSYDGKFVSSCKVNGEKVIELDVSLLSAGAYVIKVTTRQYTQAIKLIRN
jgi:WD40 repeat protein